MTMFQYFDDDGNFIIESGSDGAPLPVFKVSGSSVYISGSLLPADTGTDSPITELGSVEKPWKELYVESGSINFIDPKVGVSHNDRRVKFSRKDVEDLKAGRSLNDSGHMSASGDLHVVGKSELRGENRFIGNTSISGFTDIIGQFRVNGAQVTDFKESLDYARALKGAANPDITATEFAQLDGIGNSTIATQLAAKQATLTFGKSSGNALKSEETLSTNDVLLMGSSHVKGRTYSQFKGDLSLVKGDVGLGNVDNTSDANKPVSTATQTALNAKATTAAVAGDLLPDADGTRDLGASDKEWQDLYVDGIAYTDSISNAGTLTTVGFRATTDFASQGLHILGGSGAVTISQIPANGLLDARTANVFYMGVNGDINGIRGTRVMGQVVTIIQPNLRTNTFIHQSSNVNIHSTEKFVLTANRDLRARGPLSIRFIYDGVVRCWYRLI